MAAKYKGVRKASETSIEISFTYQGKRYFEKIKLQPTPDGLRAAADFRTEIILAIRKGTFDYAVTFPESKHAKDFIATINTLEDYLTKTYLPRFEKYGKARTVKEYCNCINNRIIPVFGKLQLNEVTIPVVKQWIDSLNLSPKTIRNYLSPLRAALNEAVEDGLIEYNPIASYSPKIRTNKPKQDKVDPITIEEELALYRHGSQQFNNILKLALWTGLRPQEYLALQWQDVDFINNTININKAKNDFVPVEATKTASSNRKLKLLEPAIEALRDQKALTYLQGEEVFLHNGKIFHGVSYMRKVEWDKTFKLAGVRLRTPKQTRHTFASRMLSNGEPLIWVSKYLGHSDPSMTLRAYARFMPSEQNEAGQSLVKKLQN